ncbi:MAG TPA: SGNH/GDSL hydrolase family protein [Nocardioides sp.]|jgi:hypothetical protein
MARRSVRRPLAALAALAAGALGATALTVPLSTATAAAPVYVALGDSYSSGTGTRDYIDDGTTCQRSTYAYPALIAAAQRYDLNFRACSGAKVPDVTNTQLGALSTGTSYVTVSVGGNDAGFADVLTTCAQPWWAADCDGAIDDAQAYINNILPGALATLYGKIRTRAPYAKVVVVGYPRIFMGEDCNAGTWFSPSEMTRLNATADLLNSTTGQQASTAGFSFANPTSRFIGHAVCDDPEWVNGLSSPISESYHPNKPGHSSGYTPTVSGPLTGSTFVGGAKVTGRAARMADALAARQRQYAAQDASIEPEVFRAPDLTTPEARRAAERAGVDLDRFIARSR